VRVAVFHGSPREGGNTGILLLEAVRGAAEKGAEITRFDLSSMDIKPCQHCGGCEETGACVIRDDMDGVYDAIRASARFIFSSPIFFMNVSAQAKAMIDRCQSFWCEKYLLKRPIQAGPEGRKGLFITVGGMAWKEGLQCSEATARAFFRTISVPEHRTLGYLKVDAKGDILKHPEAFRECYEAGRELLK
jgi:multimeric flavodoxin WrbA